MNKLSLLAALALSVTLVACGGGGDDDDDDLILPDADTTTPDAPVGGGPDAPVGGGGAENVGKACNAAMPCPGGETCAGLEAGAMSGICTIPCPTQGEEGTCGAANGFPGPGVGYCALSDGMTPPTFYCAVGCGEQNGGNTSCPTGTTCKDLINMNMVGDLCAP